MKMKLLYIIPHRNCNPSRQKNITMALNWLTLAKKKFTEEKSQIIFDVAVVEQASEPDFNGKQWGIKEIYLFNPGVFNKGWAFNVVVKQYPDYDYYIFADGDIIYPDIESFYQQITLLCQTQPQPAFRLFKECLDTNPTDLLNCNDVGSLIDLYNNGKLTLVKRYGLTFAGGTIAISRATYDKIGGWDEQFEGWGRHDDFMTLKLFKLGHCEKIIAPLSGIHLWHPIMPDFSLKQPTILLYNEVSKYSVEQLTDLIEKNHPLIGNPLKYRILNKPTVVAQSKPAPVPAKISLVVPAQTSTPVPAKTSLGVPAKISTPVPAKISTPVPDKKLPIIVNPDQV